MISELGRYASANSGDDAVVRDSLRLPPTPAAELELVQLERICLKANTAYRLRLANSGGKGFSNQVYVVRIGGTYAVLDPDFNYGKRGNWTIVMMDRGFRPLAVY